MDSAVHLPILVNALAHVAGVAAFGVFLWLLARNRSMDTRAPAGAAALALCWNLGSLVVLLATPGSAVSELVASLSFAVLSLLPCVLLHLALGADYPVLRYAGYAIGAVASLAHLSEALALEVASHEFGVRLITYAFGALAVAAAVLLTRAAGMRALAAISLFLFAASFIHFSAEHGPGSWGHELIFHHAGIPFALFVLLQDFRFLLLDVFVRIAGGAVLAAGLAAMLVLAGERLDLLTPGDPLPLVAFVTLICASILGFPYIRDRLRGWVEAALFRRGDLGAALDRIRALEPQNEDQLFEEAARVIAEFAAVRRWSLGPDSEAWTEQSLTLAESKTLSLGPREGGRRYLSDDLADLDALAAELAERREALRREEQRRLLSEAELEALRAQINPHFLFNALNALYGVIPRSAADARTTLVNLADIFRYALEGKRQLVSLADELRVVEAYLQIERLRFGARLSTEVEVEDGLRALQVPALSIQPLVENAVKHGVADKPSGGRVRVSAVRSNGCVAIGVSDDGVGFDTLATQPGHGLSNVRRRLELCYGGEVELRIRSSDEGTTAEFDIPSAR